MKAPNPLLLYEAVCRQLGIIQYHSSVKPLDVEEKCEIAKQTQKNKSEINSNHSTSGTARSSNASEG